MGVVKTILQQLAGTTATSVFCSWGVSQMYATQIVMPVNGMDFSMAALVMEVNGFNFKGKLYVALDEGSDYYRIYCEKNGILKEEHHDIGVEELGAVLDSMIEHAFGSHMVISIIPTINHHAMPMCSSTVTHIFGTSMLMQKVL